MNPMDLPRTRCTKKGSEQGTTAAVYSPSSIQHSIPKVNHKVPTPHREPLKIIHLPPLRKLELHILVASESAKDGNICVQVVVGFILVGIRNHHLSVFRWYSSGAGQEECIRSLAIIVEVLDEQRGVIDLVDGAGDVVPNIHKGPKLLVA